MERTSAPLPTPMPGRVHPLRGVSSRRGLPTSLVAVVSLMLLAVPTPAGATTCLPGTGTTRDPFLVASAADLEKVGSGTDGCTLAAHYLQTGDITLTAPVAPATSNHTPIGTFTGTYDGGGHTIDGLVIDRPATDDVGLFGRTSGATIRRIALTRADVTGQDDTAMLVGQASRTTVIDASASGSVTGADFVGGLIGYGPDAFVLRSWTEGTVSGDEEVGGLVGYLPYGGVRSSFSTADVTSSGAAPSSHVGGLIGYFPAVTSTTLRVVGSATAASSSGTSIVAGDVFHWTLTLDLDEAATATGSASNTYNASVDAFGLAAAPGNRGTWSPDAIAWTINPSANVDANGNGDGLTVEIAGSDAPDIDGVTFSDVEIAFGWDAADLDAVTIDRDGNGTVTLLDWFGTTRPPLDAVSYATLQLRDTGSGSASFTATIEADHPQQDDLVDVFARGDVTTTNLTTPDVGGLVGYIPSTAVARVFATGAVSAAGSGTDVGGLLGFDGSNSLTEAYWDTETTGRASSAAGTGRTTAQMTSIANYATWPIVDGWAPYDVAAGRVWGICPRVNDGYPFLLWQYDSDPCAAPVAAPQLDVTCTGPDGGGLVAGAAASCTVTGANPDIDFLWRAAHNPTFAEGVVRTDADGTGTLAFTIPAAAAGDTVTVELVAWTAPIPVGVANGPVPNAVAAGAGPSIGGIAMSGAATGMNALMRPVLLVALITLALIALMLGAHMLVALPTITSAAQGIRGISGPDVDPPA